MSFTLVKGQKTSFTTGDNKEQMFPKCPVRENNQVEMCFKATKQKAQKNLRGSEMSGGKNTFTYVRYVALESEVELKKSCLLSLKRQRHSQSSVCTHPLFRLYLQSNQRH